MVDKITWLLYCFTVFSICLRLLGIFIFHPLFKEPGTDSGAFYRETSKTIALEIIAYAILAGLVR